MTSSPIPQWAGVLLLAAFLLSMLAFAHALRRRAAITPETSRKTMHVALGAAALAFPVLFRTTWPALLVCALTIGVLLLLRSGALGPRARSVVHGIGRHSEGDLYFPISAGALFILASGDRMLYLIPLLTLTLADTAASYVGRRYGVTRFASSDQCGEKSIEGSGAFLCVALLCAFVPLVLATGVPATRALSIAAPFAVVMTLLEAAAWRGLDNVFIPIGGLLLLERLMVMSERPLTTTFAIATAMVAVAISLPPRRTTQRGVLTLLRARRAAS